MVRRRPFRSASLSSAEIGPVDLIVNFVKCYSTEAAIRAAAPLIGEKTAILTLQNGWATPIASRRSLVRTA